MASSRKKSKPGKTEKNQPAKRNGAQRRAPVTASPVTLEQARALAFSWSPRRAVGAAASTMATLTRDVTASKKVVCFRLKLLPQIANA
jgi:hypothetical protein